MSDLAALLAEHRRCEEAFVRAGETAFATFHALLDEAALVIRDADDQRPEAVAMRDRVRAAMRTAAGVEPGTEMYELTRELRASDHALRALVLSPRLTPPTSA